MELTRRQKQIKYGVYLLVLTLCHLLQNVSRLLPEIFSARCLIIIPAAIILSVGEDFFAASMLGLFSGLLWDITSAVHMGFNCIFLMLLCFLASAFTMRIARDIFITNLLLSTAAVIVYCFVYWLFFILIKGVDGGELTVITFYLPTAAYTVAVSLIMYLIIKPIKNKVNGIRQERFEG